MSIVGKSLTLTIISVIIHGLIIDCCKINLKIENNYDDPIELKIESFPEMPILKYTIYKKEPKLYPNINLIGQHCIFKTTKFTTTIEKENGSLKVYHSQAVLDGEGRATLVITKTGQTEIAGRIGVFCGMGTYCGRG